MYVCMSVCLSCVIFFTLVVLSFLSDREAGQHRGRAAGPHGVQCAAGAGQGADLLRGPDPAIRY